MTKEKPTLLKQMNIEIWIDLLGKSQDDPQVKAALAAAGVKKIPKRDKDESGVIFELKGQHLWIEMNDEAYQKHLMNQDVGEGPLLLTSVEAVLSPDKPNGGYKGSIPLGLSIDMTRADVRKVLGEPSTIFEDVPADIWQRNGLELNITYTRDLKFQTLALTLPRVK